MARKKKRYATPPLPPADGFKYILVQPKDGPPHWRKKRGSVKEAVLNSSFQKNVEATALASPAAKRIFSKLDPFLRSLDTGRFIANVSSGLKKAWTKTGKMDFSFLDKYDLQPGHTLSELLKAPYFISTDNNEISIRIPLHKTAVVQHNRYVTDYYFEAILLSGDPSKSRGLRVETNISPLYSFDQNKRVECQMRVSLPAQLPRAARNDMPWMLLLKLSCQEANQPANHPKHYGMKVVRVG